MSGVGWRATDQRVAAGGDDEKGVVDVGVAASDGWHPVDLRVFEVGLER